ncbi:hypothetical protein ACOME3_006079 [Neoechinorhynchus agilis]
MEILLSTVFQFLILLVCLFCSLVYLLRFQQRPMNFEKPCHVLISGGSSGIGLSLAVKYARMGCRLSLIARNEERLLEAKDKCEKAANDGTQVSIYPMDLSRSSLLSIRNALSDNEQPIDLLICCAGQCVSDEFINLSQDEIEQMINTNLTGTILLVRSIVSMMLDEPISERRVLLVSSQAGQIGLYGYSVYSATKFALDGFAQALQMELVKHRIFITVAYPPDTDTPGFHQERLRTPKVTKILSDSSGLWKPDDVADKIVTCLEHGDPKCSFGINGWLLALLTNGLTPVHNSFMGLWETFMYPFARIVAIFTTVRFYKVCREV